MKKVKNYGIEKVISTVLPLLNKGEILQIFIYLIEQGESDVLCKILDKGDYTSIISDFVPKYDDRGAYVTEYEDCPLLSACYGGDEDLVIKIINYGAFEIGYDKTVFNFYRDDDAMLERILKECRFENYHIVHAMDYTELFKKLVSIDNSILFRDDDIMRFALENYKHELLEFLYNQGVPLLPVKVRNYREKSFKECLKIIENFEGYREFVEINECD